MHFKECYCHIATLLSHYHVGIKTRENYKIERDNSSGRPSKNLGGETDYIKNLFTTVTGGEEEIFPLTVKEIASEQKKHRIYKKNFSKNSRNLNKRKKRTNIGSINRPNSNIMVKNIEYTEVLVYKGTKIVIPTKKLQFRVIQWYHYYLQHPGHTRLKETIKPVM